MDIAQKPDRLKRFVQLGTRLKIDISHHKTPATGADEFDFGSYDRGADCEKL